MNIEQVIQFMVERAESGTDTSLGDLKRNFMGLEDRLLRRGLKQGRNRIQELGIDVSKLSYEWEGNPTPSSPKKRGRKPKLKPNVMLEKFIPDVAPWSVGTPSSNTPPNPLEPYYDIIRQLESNEEQNRFLKNQSELNHHLMAHLKSQNEKLDFILGELDYQSHRLLAYNNFRVQSVLYDNVTQLCREHYFRDRLQREAARAVHYERKIVVSLLRVEGMSQWLAQSESFPQQKMLKLLSKYWKDGWKSLGILGYFEPNRWVTLAHGQSLSEVERLSQSVMKRILSQFEEIQLPNARSMKFMMGVGELQHLEGEQPEQLLERIELNLQKSHALENGSVVLASDLEIDKKN